MITLRDQLDVLPQVIILFEDCWVQILDQETGAHYRQDDDDNITLGGDITDLSYWDLLKKQVCAIEMNGDFLEIYIR